MNTISSSIRLEGLTKRYGPVVAVDDVSLSIDPGAFVTLLGPRGSGKTKTMRMIAGLESPSAGSIFFPDRMDNCPGVFVPTQRRHQFRRPADRARVRTYVLASGEAR